VPSKSSLSSLPSLNDERRREQCCAIRKDLVNKISYIINMIADKVSYHNIELRLPNIVVLSLHLPIYIRAHLDIGRDLVMGIDYIEHTSSFYLMFPLMDNESIFIEAGGINDEITV
jgi:hypothetical protein